jgi:hypothetical protein
VKPRRRRSRTSSVLENLLVLALAVLAIGIALGVLAAPPLIIYLWLQMTGWPAALLTAGWVILLLVLIVILVLLAD